MTFIQIYFEKKSKIKSKKLGQNMKKAKNLSGTQRLKENTLSKVIFAIMLRLTTTTTTIAFTYGGQISTTNQNT